MTVREWSKELILTKLHDILDERIKSATEAVKSAKESRDSDTKSSAGDKYETAREMIQIEMNKYEGQLRLAKNLKNELSRINTEKGFIKADFGSIVVTDKGTYFLSIGIGKIEVENETCFAISLASPIGELFKGKSKGDKIKFQDREFLIRDIY